MKYLLIILLSFNLFANVPNIFSSGELLSASKLNENFNHYNSGEIIQTQIIQDCTRRGWNNLFYEFDFNKKISDSKIFIISTVSGYGDASGAVDMYYTTSFDNYNQKYITNTFTYSYDSGTDYCKSGNFKGLISNVDSTGNIHIKLNLGGTNQRPFNIINPNASDDNRLTNGTCSFYEVREIKN